MTVVAPTVLDETTAHSFRLALLAALNANVAVTVDMTGVRVLKPGGAAVLVGAFRRAAATGRVLRTEGLSTAASNALAGLGLTGWVRPLCKGAA